jgi:hypothetical protein
MAREMAFHPLSSWYNRNWARFVSAFAAWRVGQGLQVRLIVANGARKSEVANLHRAILVHKTIRWLQISMIDPGRVKVLEADKKVVEQSIDVK